MLCFEYIDIENSVHIRGIGFFRHITPVGTLLINENWVFFPQDNTQLNIFRNKNEHTLGVEGKSIEFPQENCTDIMIEAALPEEPGFGKLCVANYMFIKIRASDIVLGELVKDEFGPHEYGLSGNARIVDLDSASDFSTFRRYSAFPQVGDFIRKYRRRGD